MSFSLKINPRQLFSLKGRISRKTCISEQIVLMTISALLLGSSLLATHLGAPEVVGKSFLKATEVVFGWLYVTVGVRRLHDMNRSGWWLLSWYSAIGLLVLAAKETPQIALDGLMTRQQGIVLLLVEGAVGLGLMLHLVYTVFAKEGDAGDNRFGTPDCGAGVRITRT